MEEGKQTQEGRETEMQIKKENAYAAKATKENSQTELSRLISFSRWKLPTETDG
jgi:hypothetical protein